MSWLKKETDSIVINIKVTPRSSTNAFGAIRGDYVQVNIKAPPVDGKANQALIKFIAKEFGVRQNDINMLRGDSSRSKSLRINRVTTLPSALMELLEDKASFVS